MHKLYILRSCFAKKNTPWIWFWSSCRNLSYNNLSGAIPEALTKKNSTDKAFRLRFVNDWDAKNWQQVFQTNGSMLILPSKTKCFNGKVPNYDCPLRCELSNWTVQEILVAMYKMIEHGGTELHYVDLLALPFNAFQKEKNVLILFGNLSWVAQLASTLINLLHNFLQLGW